MLLGARTWNAVAKNEWDGTGSVSNTIFAKSIRFCIPFVEWSALGPILNQLPSISKVAILPTRRTIHMLMRRAGLLHDLDDFVSDRLR